MSKITFFFAVLFFTALFNHPFSAQDARFRVPLNGGTIVCVFNDTQCAVSGQYHTGIDYHATDGNKDILATNAGKIVSITYNGSQDHGMGNAVIIEHKIVNVQGGVQYLYSLYAHQDSVISGLYVGEAVVKGQKIGTMGSTGYGQSNYWGSTPHLHFEIKAAAVLHNPSNPSGNSQYWGYTPSSAVNYGYIDPTWFINSSSTAIGNDYAFWNFSGANNFEGWTLIHIEAASVTGGNLFDDPQTTDPYLFSPDIYVDAAALPYVKLRFASNAPDGIGAIYFKTATENLYTPDKRVPFTVANCNLCGNADFRVYSVPMSVNSKWTGKITGIRLDPAESGRSGTNTDSIGIDYIKLTADSSGGDQGGAVDEFAPNLTVASLANGQTFNSSVITVSGTASDYGRGESGISSVTVNGVRASNDTASVSATANWSHSITLNSGANTITVIARDNSPSQNAATQTLTVYYQMPGGATPTPTPTPAAPNFTSAASATPNSTVVNQSVAVQVSFTSGSSAGNVIADTEIYDANNQRVFQSFTEHQDFGSGQTRVYTLNWTPVSAGQFKVKTAVFNADWLTSYHWNDAALVVNVGSASPPPPASSPAFSATASAAPNLATLNQPVSVSATVNNSGGAASDVIVDVEVYDSAGVRAFQYFYEHQDFTAGNSRVYAPSWTPAAAGQYTVKVGIFRNDWAVNYSWNDSATIINVNPSAPPAPAYDINVWWVTDGAQVSGTQPFKAVVNNLNLSQYTMSWQVDGGALVPMIDNYQDAPHKEANVDLSGWTWRGTGTYNVNFVAKDANGSVIAQRSVNIYVSH